MRLLALEGHAPGTEYALGGRAFTVGRSTASSLTLDDDDVSREHCRIRPTEDGYVIEDLNSRNGTIVNGQRIARPTPLHPGDLVIVGRALFEVRATSPLPRASTASRSGREPSPRPAMPPVHSRPGPPPVAATPPTGPRRPTRADARSAGTLAADAEEVALRGRQVRRRVAELARQLNRVDDWPGVLAVFGSSAGATGAFEADRLIAVCATAASDRGVRNLVDTLGAEAHALHRVVSLALALHEAVGG